MNSENPQNRNLRDIFGKFATGVCAISFYGKDKKPRGITVNSFASVSLNPPLTSVSYTHLTLPTILLV